ncbi:tetratricopeptide repeat protein [Clostridium polynesiense]|uniref:tetratricopeptide repeat protein n=1 Tax=Clostridium polynesiense TaxID=1325933 RepID=UPI00058E2DD4|nr:tetratricopeptide repeat protein [Clostridium polynesiense]
MGKERELAGKYLEEKRYEESEKIYFKLWNDSVNDKWLSWEYAKTLKGLGNFDKAIKVCKTFYKKDNSFKYVNDLLSWCLYEKYIINMNDINDTKEMLNVEKIGRFIISIVDNNKNTPYEIIIFKFLKKYKKPFNAIKLKEWLQYIEPDKLSDTPFKFNDNKGKSREYASKREEYYYLKCKSLYILSDYAGCIKECDEALQNIATFHFDYNIWIRRFKALSTAELGDKLKAIKILKSILHDKEHWIIYFNIFEMYVSLKMYDNGLVYAYKAALMDGDKDVKVVLFEKIGDVLLQQENKDIALRHYILSKEIRMKKNWNIGNNLMRVIDSLKVTTNVNNLSYSHLRDYWIKETIKSKKRESGTIVKVIANGKSGFIKNERNSYFFKKVSILNNNKNFYEGLRVTFSIVDSFDNKKGIKSKEAIDIILGVE